MKVHILSLSMLAALFGVVGCSKPSTEIVESDYSYTLDKNVISVDMPEKFLHNPSNLVANATEEEILIVLNDRSLPEGTDDYTFTASVKLKRPMDAPLKVIFKPNTELVSSYKATLGEEYSELAATDIEGLEFSIPAGVGSFDAKLKLKNAREILKSDKSLCGVYSLYMEDEQDGVMISKHSADLYVRVFSSTLTEKENVTNVPGSRIPQGWKLMDSSKITAASNYRNDLVGRIVDGDSSWRALNWWVPSKGLNGSDAILSLFFDEAKVVGFRIIENNPPKTFKSFDVAVSVDNGDSNYAWGSITENYQYRSALIVKFNEPELINTISLYNIMSHTPGSDSYVDVHEIEIYTVD